MNNYDKVYIYFDTNSLEKYVTSERIGHKKGSKNSYLYLNDIKFPKYYFQIVNFIKDNSLKDKVDICISEVVIKELKHHLRDQYDFNKKIFCDTVRECEKCFSSLISIEYKFEDINYDEEVDDLLKKENIKVISVPKDEEALDKIINKAITHKKPFTEANNKDKTYTDAGFKDALVVESIIKNSANNIYSIFVTKDNDFDDVFSAYPNITICKYEKVEDRKNFIINKLKEIFYTQDNEFNIDRDIKNNDYILKQVIDFCGLDPNLDYKFTELLSESEYIDLDNGVDNVWEITFKMFVGKKELKFYIRYDKKTNTLEDAEIIDD